MFDTGKCVPESKETLLIQQRQLMFGKRDVQMFPIGTKELKLPKGFKRFENSRGVFHFNGDKITKEEINSLSQRGMENLFLNLGPFDKQEILNRLNAGEALVFLTEYTKDGVEVRSVAGTNMTVQHQYEYFERTKEPDNIIVAEPPKRVIENGN